jgi:predicted metal-dependent hydrolase
MAKIVFTAFFAISALAFGRVEDEAGLKKASRKWASYF